MKNIYQLYSYNCYTVYNRYYNSIIGVVAFIALWHINPGCIKKLLDGEISCLFPILSIFIAQLFIIFYLNLVQNKIILI